MASRFDYLFPHSALESTKELPGLWSNPFEAIDAERAGEMPPASFRAKGWDYCFPQSTVISAQVADWISTTSTDTQGIYANPLEEAAEFLRDELDRSQPTDAAAALQETVERYVEDNDELFWEEPKSPDAFERLRDCDFRALAWYFQPAFTQMLESQALSVSSPAS